MTIKTAVAALASDGYLTDSYEALNKLVLYFLASDQSQTVYFKENITSLKYIYSECVEDITQLPNKVQVALTKYLSVYFKDVIITSDISNDSLYINISVSDTTGRLVTINHRLPLEFLGNGDYFKLLEYIHGYSEQ